MTFAVQVADYNWNTENVLILHFFSQTT
jgi:hypothetical protein